jgi:xanthine dehydrogenase/oxidase
VRSGALNLDRGLSRGEQSYDTDESLWPVSEPIEKVESKWQTSGELKYVGDIPSQQGELHSAFVLSKRANCDVVSVNATRALVRGSSNQLLFSVSYFRLCLVLLTLLTPTMFQE